jgi:hypothetical protein
MNSGNEKRYLLIRNSKGRNLLLYGIDESNNVALDWLELSQLFTIRANGGELHDGGPHLLAGIQMRQLYLSQAVGSKQLPVLASFSTSTLLPARARGDLHGGDRAAHYSTRSFHWLR